MRVLMITGDKNILTPGTSAYTRLELQRAHVESLDIVYWGRGSVWPHIPQGPFDVVTSQDPLWRGLFALRVARRFKARLNIQVHIDMHVLNFFKKRVARFVLSRADSIRVVSERIKKQVEVLGVRPPLYVLPVYIDLQRFKAVTRRPGEQKTVLWIGRFEAEKDPLSAIYIIEKIREKIPDVRLIMLGAGSMEENLKHRARGLPVEFPGWQDSAMYLERADVVLSTSPYESWGASIVEALAAGVPVVSRDVGVAREAGAVVAQSSELAEKTIEVIRTKPQGKLLLNLPSAEEWATQWRNTL